MIECQKHSQVKFLRTKHNKIRILKYVTYSRVIYHACYSKHHNQSAYSSSNVKTYYMLDFNEVFLYEDKCGKHAGNAEKERRNAEKTRKIADSEVFLADAVRCRRQSTDTDALRCGRGLFAHLYPGLPTKAFPVY